MPANDRIAILTGGGDVPGLNSVIKAVVYRATEMGREVIGIRKGWEGLTHQNPDQEMDPEYELALNRDNTRTIDRFGGTFLHTSRTNPISMKAKKLPSWVNKSEVKKLEKADGVYDFTPIVLKNLEKRGVGTLIAIGGDDTLSYATQLHQAGFPVIGVPKTMDNDVQGTEYCIGFSTAITRARELVTRQRTTLGSHERIGVFRIFGRDAGYTALYTAYVCSTRCVIPEYEFDLKRLIELLMEDKRSNPSRYAIIIASEGAMWKGGQLDEYGEADAFGHRKKVDVGHALASAIKKLASEDTMTSDLTYDLRSGEPDMLDQIVATTFANVAMDLIREGISGRMTAIRDGKYIHSPLPPPGRPRCVNVSLLYDTERYRPNYGTKLGMPLLLDSVQ
jgi:6-phosphofructokinase 1